MYEYRIVEYPDGVTGVKQEPAIVLQGTGSAKVCAAALREAAEELDPDPGKAAAQAWIDKAGGDPLKALWNLFGGGRG